MRAKVIRSYTDKYTMKSIERGTEIEITEERFSELTTGPLGVFVEEIKEKTQEDPPKEPQNDSSIENTEIDFEKMTKKDLVEYATSKEIELDMDMTKKEMIDILLKK